MIVVVGDIHGCLDPLKALIKRKERSGKRWGFNMEYLFLGDYIDRGPCIKEVLDYLIAKETGKVLQVDLDTGAVYGGRLSSITFRRQMRKLKFVTHEYDISAGVCGSFKGFLRSLASYSGEVSFD
jgi:hypothetical protein